MTTPTIQSLDQLVIGIRHHLDASLVTKMNMGEPVTHQFRTFCEDEGVDLIDGMYCPRRPYPFALHNPMVCRQCGWIERADQLDRDERHVKVCDGGYGPEADPDEYALVCPNCEAHDSYDEQTMCSECWEYPCICEVTR